MNQDLSHLPAAVRAQHEAAMAAMKSAQESDAAAAHAQAGAPPTPPAEHSHATVVPPAAREAAPPATPFAGPLQGDGKDYKSMYNVLQGKYNAEVPQLHRQVADMQRELNELRQQVAERQLNASVTPSVTHQQASGFDVDAHIRATVSEELIDEFGMDYWRGVIATTRKLNEQASHPDSERIAHLEGQIAATQRDRYFASLDGLVPNWREIDTSPGWEKMLGEVEPLSGQTYGQLVESAHGAHDANRVATILKEYLRRAGGGGQARSPLENQVIPTGSGGGPTPPAAGGGITLKQWEAEMHALMTSGKPTSVIASEQAKLTARLQQGIAQGTGQQAQPSFV